MSRNIWESFVLGTLPHRGGYYLQTPQQKPTPSVEIVSPVEQIKNQNKAEMVMNRVGETKVKRMPVKVKGLKTKRPMKKGMGKKKTKKIIKKAVKKNIKKERKGVKGKQVKRKK